MLATRASDAAPRARTFVAEGRVRNLPDIIFTIVLALGGAAIALTAILLLISMIQRGGSALATFGLAFLTESTWNPVTHTFGILPAIYGTLIVSAVALLLAVPFGMGAAIFLAEMAPPWLANPISMLIEMLAAIPSVIIGLWGLFVIVPVVRNVERFIGGSLGFLPIFSGPAFGIGILSAGVVLAIMVLPIITAVTRDVIRAVPVSQREAMLALGATHWETIARAVLPYGVNGIVGAIILALGRALGETLAVSMVVGNTFKISASVFAPATTLSSLIATQFREADTPLYLSALMAAGLVLFGIALLVNLIARALIWRLTTRAPGH